MKSCAFQLLGACFLCIWHAMASGKVAGSLAAKLDQRLDQKAQEIRNRVRELPSEFLVQLTRHVPKEKMKEQVTMEYEQVQRASGEHMHDVVIAIRQKNIDQLEAILHDVSNPTSPRYGMHLTNAEVMALTANTDSTAHVIRYMRQNGVQIVRQTPHGDFITARASVATWESVLQCRFYEFRAKANADFRLVRTPQYSLAETVTDHILTVFNTVHFPPPRYLRAAKPRILSNTELMSGTAGYVTPALLKSHYSIATSLGNSYASQSVYEALGQTFSPSDLTLFQRQFNLTVEAVTTVIGGHSSDKTCRKNNGENCVEANLDVQYLMAVAPHIPTTYYYWGGEDFMVDWITAVAAMASPPKVISISYGIDEGYLTAAYGEAFNIQAIKLGVQGVTITASSGDDGVAGNAARSNSFLCGYRPSFPASSPYVTAVGGTMGPEQHQPETACQSDRGGLITTGGGFSDLFPMPAWQQDAVSAYLDRVQGTAQEAHAGYNRRGRGYPDVSALGYNYIIAVGHNFTAVSGTSASSPVVAGMISLVNAARLAAGKSALGWVNPALYRYASQYTLDIVEGDNRCAAEATVCCSHGFYAAEGWDAVTGLGSINFTSFHTALFHAGEEASPVSARPSAAPTRHSAYQSPPPSQHPTTTPTLAAGWMSLISYDSENCEGRATTVSAVPSSYCMRTYDSDLEPTGSMQYVCEGDDTATVFVYSDGQCSPHAVTDRTRIFMGCAYHVEQYYYGPSTSTEVRCTPGSSLPPLPAYDGSYVLQTSYDSEEGCEDGFISAVDAVLQNHCFNLPSQSSSYLISFPELVVYQGLDCRPRFEEGRESLPTDCQSSLNADDDYSAGGYYDYGYGYTRAYSRQLQYYEDTTTTELFSIWSVADEPPAGSTASPSLLPVSAPSSSPTRQVTTPAPTRTPSSPPTPATITSRPTTETRQNVSTSLSPTCMPTIRPTVAPSRSSPPTVHPTRATTLAPVRIHSSSNLTVHMQQVLDGITAVDWKQSAAKNALVFTSALAASLEDLDIPSSHILVVDVQDVPETAPQERQANTVVEHQVAGKVSSASTWQCRVLYAIVVSPRQHGWASASQAVAVIESTLVSAVQGQGFDTYLTFYAATWQAADLMQVTSSTVWVESVQTSSSTEDSHTSQAGGIIGGVIGGLLAMLLLAGIVGYAGCGWMTAMKQQMRRTSYAQVSLDTDSVHAAINPIVQRQHLGVQEDEGEEETMVEIELGVLRMGGGTQRGEQEGEEEGKGEGRSQELTSSKNMSDSHDASSEVV